MIVFTIHRCDQTAIPQAAQASERSVDVTILDRFRLDGKVAIVTGAAGGLGAAIAQALAEAGADVVLADIREAGLDGTRSLVEAAGRRVIGVSMDISDPAACQALVGEACDKLGRIDVLVNNAAIGATCPALRESPEEFRAVTEVNLHGTFWMAQAAARVMERGSSIVNVTSIAAFLSVGKPQAAYTASKAALIGLTRDLAQQWTGRQGIRVNAVAPGIFQTDMTRHFFDELLDVQGPRIPMGRAGDPAELAAAVVFLASDASSYITGETLIVDGGRTLL